jgi:Xaa-Pro aminopeptidase
MFNNVIKDNSMPAYGDRLKDLRQLINQLGGHGFLVPRTDAFQGEYVAPCDERLAWLTGFTGSAGMAIILSDKAAIFVDGRYTLQAQLQVDSTNYEVCSLIDPSPWSWTKKHFKSEHKILYDPWLHTVNDKDRFTKLQKDIGATFSPIPHNLIDKIWADRPASPLDPIYIHDLQYAGVSSQEKRIQIALTLRDKQADAALITAPDSIAWLLNVRGNDIPHTPVAQAFAMIWADTSVDLFISPQKVTEDVKQHLGKDVRVSDMNAIEHWLSNLKDKMILIDPASTPLALSHQLEKCHLIHSVNPCMLPKACKNTIEAAGAKDSHIHDGVAVTRFLAWLSNAIPQEKITEIDASEKLLSFRQQHALFKDTSFETISGAGPNGAIVHYHSTPSSNREIAGNILYLVDSGGQYLNGTTDITRTIAIGTPSHEQKDRFTRVLKGHIAIATALFPIGTTGSQLDPLARHSLWQVGLDYEHGTGHGVGSYLNVHEGPQRISKAPSTVPLQPGMIVSNEPGYYKTNEYGIRIESLVIVVEKGVPDRGEKPLLGFETLTVVPIDINLVQIDLLTDHERDWLNAYHRKVRETLLPYLNGDEAEWLKKATKEI